MKKATLIFAGISALFLLSGCRRMIVLPPDSPRTANEPAIVDNDSGSNEEELARQSVQYAGDFVFGGDESHLQEVTDETPTEIRVDMKEALMDKQVKLLGGEQLVRTLSLDGVPASAIINDYADKVLAGLHTITDYTVTDAEIAGDDDITVTMMLTPIRAVDLSLTGTERLRALKNFVVKAADKPYSFTFRLDQDRYGVDLDDEFFEKLVIRSLY